MTITLGRVGLTQSGITLRDPERWTWRGNVLTLSGLAGGSSYTESRFLRDQLVGLDSNPDEPFIAVTWTVDAQIDGYYRVLSVDAPSELSSYVNFHWPYTITLERVPTVYGHAGVESSIVGAVVSNGAGITTARHWHAAPNQVDYWPGEAGTHASTTRATDSGTLVVAYYSIAAAGPWDLNARFSCPASDYYDGAARIEVDIGGDTWRTVVGRTSAMPINIQGFRLNNGLIRYNFGSAKLEVYNGSSWEEIFSSQFDLYSDGSAVSTALSLTSFVQILRNSPEEVAIRHTRSIANSLDVVTVDLTLRRGAFHVAGLIQCTRTVYTWAFKGPTGGSAAIGTNSYTRNSDDANGNRWFTTWLKAATVNSGTGAHYLNATTDSAGFMIGAYLNYATATGGNSAAVIQEMIWSAETERMTVVRR